MKYTKFLFSVLFAMAMVKANAQITMLQDYTNTTSTTIGSFMGISFREAGFSGIYPVPGTNGKEFWLCSDRGVNVDCANANPAGCKPTYDKMYGFATYAPKIHRVRIQGGSVQILQTITVKRPGGSGATGIINPTGLGSTVTEVASTDTVLDCANFNTKTALKDTFGIDCEGIVVDKNGFFWLCEEGGPTVWKLDQNGVVVKRFTPYFNLPGVQPVDAAIDTCFKYRKNNRGFESIAIAPNGKIYVIIQSPLLYPTLAVGESTRVHRMLEIDPATNAMRMLVYLNDGIIGASGANQIRLRDWKIGDMAAINDSTFLVLEAALRGTTDIKRMYMININGATAVHSGNYGAGSLEALVDSAGLAANGVVAVRKTLVMDLLANSWPSALDKAEGIAILNDSTIAVCNDNDYGQTCPAADGIPVATSNLSHIITYQLSGANKLAAFKAAQINVDFGLSGPSSSKSPYMTPAAPGVKLTSILTAGDSVGGYGMAGAPDGVGVYDNNNGTFTMLVNHEFVATAGAVHAHGAKGAFVSKWVINKSDLSVVSGADLTQNVQLYNPIGGTYTLFTPGDTTWRKAFNRFCSADLPAVPAFYNAATGLGTQERIFMNGEESGNEGRAFGHIVTGANAGTTWELPALGKFSWENAVASYSPQDKTVVAGLDDSTPGQVYMYIGTKTNTGSEVEKAGLTNGKLYGVAVQGLTTEVNATFPAANTPFTLVDLGNVKDSTGFSIQNRSVALGVTNFLRPEDGVWDPNSPNDFYFVTTNAITSPSRMWRLRFDNINTPELGGKITAVLDGTEGPKMMDNIGIDNYGHILIVEDVGGNAHLGKTWQYTISTDQIKLIASHDSTRFLNGAPNFLTQDEEASGIVDAEAILGKGNFLVVDQAHYPQPGGLVEGGQLLKLYNPDTYKGKALSTIAAARAANATDTVRVRGIITRAHGRLLYMQDATAGIAVFQSSGAMFDSIASGWLKPGDSIEVTAPRVNFSNLQEISLSNGAYTEFSMVTKLATGLPLPQPITLTVEQMNQAGEQYESRLIKIVNLKAAATGNFAAATNYTVWDGATPGDTIVLRTPGASDTELENAPALAIPKGLFTYVGVPGQFCSSPANGCTTGYQLQGIIKATDILPQLTAVNLLAPANNHRIVTNPINTTPVGFRWSSSVNATSYKWFLTSSAGTFTAPWVITPAGADTFVQYTISQFDTLAGTHGIAKGDSVLVKWTAYAYLGTDSMMAAQTNNLWIVREVPAPNNLTPFDLVAPASNTRFVVEQGGTAQLKATWTKSQNATKYKHFITTLSDNFAAPLNVIFSDVAGTDSSVNLVSGSLNSIVSGLGIAKGDSVDLKWTVFAYKNPTDSLKATQDFILRVIRKRNLAAFSLLAPADNSRLEVETGSNTPVVITWQASATGATYKWLIDAQAGNFANPWSVMNADNSGGDTKLTLTSGALDNLLSAKSVADGDSVNLKWTVRAYETGDSLQAAQTFNIKVVRKLNTGLNDLSLNASVRIFPNPTSGNTTLQLENREQGEVSITISDIHGREMIVPIRTNGASAKTELPTADFANGIYFVKISSGNRSANFKLLVIH